MKQGIQSRCTGMTLRDGMGREVGGIQDGEHMYTHDWFMSMYGKNYNIVKPPIHNKLIKKKEKY